VGMGMGMARFLPSLQQSMFPPTLTLIGSFHIVTATPGQVITTSGVPVATVESTTVDSTVVETSPPTTTDNSGNSSSSGLSTADLIGIIVSAVGAVATIIFGIIAWRQGRKKNTKNARDVVGLGPVYHAVPPPYPIYQAPPPPQRSLWNPWYS
jgi:hypothetical protein